MMDQQMNLGNNAGFEATGTGGVKNKFEVSMGRQSNQTYHSNTQIHGAEKDWNQG